ncbi:DnaD domain protein [Oceanobacillus profundus]|uniref:DnaD domain-containing protein n=1 Tax=Oceanobacillus profundus TaxID=372463 RepID=UPI00203CBFF8|nr:DnaD domain protein [Oceanobacillus profundus]MCM3396457.1 DnaD domain protein [Oceanobacillus profundus]
MSGWIKLHRKILDNEIWNDVTTFRLFTLLLLRASHKDGIKTKSIVINRGQYLRSYSKLAEDLEFKEGRGFKKVSKSTIKRSVQKLIDAGMVTVSETDSGTVFTIAKYQDYQAIDEDTEDVSGTDSDTLTERTQNEVGTNPEQEQELKNLRIKELKESTTTADAKNDDAIVYYQNNIGMIRPGITEEMLDWINDMGDEMVIEALKRSLDRNKPSWGYAKSILKSWHEKGIKSIEQADAEEVEFRNQQTSSKPFYPRQQQAEVVPDWFKNKKHKQATSVEQTAEENDDIAEQQRRVAERLRQFAK